MKNLKQAFKKLKVQDESGNKKQKQKKPLIIYETKKAEVGSDLYDAYQAAESRNSKILVSLTNAALTHNRLYFAFSRKLLRDIINFDENFNDQNRPNFYDNEYSQIIAYLLKSNWFSQEHNPETTKARIWRIGSDNFFRKYLIISPEEEKLQASQGLDYLGWL